MNINRKPRTTKRMNINKVRTRAPSARIRLMKNRKNEKELANMFGSMKMNTTKKTRKPRVKRRQPTKTKAGKKTAARKMTKRNEKNLANMFGSMKVTNRQRPPMNN